MTTTKLKTANHRLIESKGIKDKSLYTRLMLLESVGRMASVLKDDSDNPERVNKSLSYIASAIAAYEPSGNLPDCPAHTLLDMAHLMCVDASDGWGYRDEIREMFGLLCQQLGTDSDTIETESLNALKRLLA